MPLPRRPFRLEPLEDRATPATFTVTSLADSGAGTLRDALTRAAGPAGADAADDTVTFQPGLTGTVRLTSALPDLASPAGKLSVVGPGSGKLTLERVADGTAPRFGVLRVPEAATVAVSGLTVTKGDAAGGGVFNRGTLTLTDVAVTANGSDGFGGGLYNTGPHERVGPRQFRHARTGAEGCTTRGNSPWPASRSPGTSPGSGPPAGKASARSVGAAASIARTAAG